MNKKSNDLYPTCEICSKLGLSKYTFTSFFNENKGKIKEAKTKPQLSDDHKSQRVVFSKKNKKRLNRKKIKERSFIIASSTKNSFTFLRIERSINIYLLRLSKP